MRMTEPCDIRVISTHEKCVFLVVYCILDCFDEMITWGKRWQRKLWALHVRVRKMPRQLPQSAQK